MSQVRRRQFLLVSGALIAAPIVHAQYPEKARRIGFLCSYPAGSAAGQRHQQNLLTYLGRLGHAAGKNLVIEWRFSDERQGNLPQLADELVHRNPELIVAAGNEAIAAAKQATRTIPIVMQVGSAPVESGFIESLARPGGNITGTVWSGPEHHSKCLEMLKQAAPKAERIAVTWNPTYPFEELRRTVVNAAASKLGMQLSYFYMTRPEEVRPALELIAAARPDALYVTTERVQISQSRVIGAFAVEKKLIAISNGPGFVADGLLLYYGPILSSIFERTADYVDRILRGAKPVNLPVEMPTKYELVINGKTARAIGFKPPSSFMVGVDRTIE